MNTASGTASSADIDAGRTGGTGSKCRHDRQHGRPGAPLCSRHKKGTQETEALGRSRGGFTTKLHARCDAKGRPLGFVLTPGQTHDTQGFAPLIRMITDQSEAFLADKGYGSLTPFAKRSPASIYMLKYRC
ncbi:IS4/IS5 family transposase [Ochrobactrum intermedium]|nr:IS4/IS5 family transposase [Brucella intermedia]